MREKILVLLVWFIVRVLLPSLSRYIMSVVKDVEVVYSAKGDGESKLRAVVNVISSDFPELPSSIVHLLVESAVNRMKYGREGSKGISGGTEG